jgi:hypothetical protein
VSQTITVPAALASCLRDGLFSELGNAAEKVMGLTEHPCERSLDEYYEPVRTQRKAQLLLEEIGGETPDPPLPVVAGRVHRFILLRALEEQQRSYIERREDLDDDEQNTTDERVQELDALINTVKATEPPAE